MATCGLPCRFLVFTLIIFTVVSQGAGSTTRNCDVVLAGNDVPFNRCLHNGYETITKYIQKMQKVQEGRGMKFIQKKCNEFRPFLECLQPYLDDCRDVAHELRHHVVPFIQTMTCLCDADSTECPVTSHSVRCMEEEYGGALAARCDSLHKFNQAQDVVTGSCRLIHEHILCQEALVTSHCGPQAGAFALHLSKLYWLAREPTCAEPLLEHSHNHYYRYTSACPPDLFQHVDDCTSGLEKLEFLASNLLVPVGGKKNIKTACRSYKEYENCTRPYERQCPDGRALVLRHQEKLRLYRMRLDHICSREHKAVFKDNVACYQRIERLDASGSCITELGKTLRTSRKVNAYMFYCRPEHPDSRAMKAAIAEAISCYRDVYTTECNEEAAQTMTALMEKTFADPFVFDYKYTPQCDIFENKTTTEAALKTKPHVDGGHLPEFASQTTESRGSLSQTRKNKVVPSSPGPVAKELTSSTVVMDEALSVTGKETNGGVQGVLVKEGVAAGRKPTAPPSGQVTSGHDFDRLRVATDTRDPAIDIKRPITEANRSSYRSTQAPGTRPAQNPGPSSSDRQYQDRPPGRDQKVARPKSSAYSSTSVCPLTPCVMWLAACVLLAWRQPTWSSSW